MDERVKDLPNLPGIYLFKKDGQLLYVGKAKSLRKRVVSYFRKRQEDWKIDALINEHTTIEHIVTKNEIEAELLEAQLIKQYQPRYNVLLKSGQPFLYLLFTNDPLPELELVRNKKKKGTYFGPFLHKQKARSAYRYLVETFHLYLCHKKIAGGCLHYHLGRCSGMCRDDFDKEGYIFRLGLAKKLLKGQYAESLKALKEQVALSTQQLAFERARNLYQYMLNLEEIFHTLKTKFSEDKYAAETVLVTAPTPSAVVRDPRLPAQIQQLLNLDKAPSTIDCFDVSHVQGRFIVGSCIRFTHGLPDKNKFRRFKIRTLTQQNDYAALQEIISRRYKDPAELPDLVLIDGGKGQLNAAKELLAATPVAALAKREERLFSDAHPQGIVLDPQSDVGRLFMALRDYAHHFAVSYHKKRRLKAVGQEE